MASLGRYFCRCSAVPNSTSGIVPMPTCAPKLTANDPWRLAASVIRLELVLSPPRPPYASGTSWPSRPTAPAFCRSSRIRPGFFSISATRGTTSRRMKSSAVSFIIRCSSESISGVKMVTEPVGSRRNPPPGDSVMACISRS